MHVCNIYHTCEKSSFILLLTFTFIFLQPSIKKQFQHIKHKLAAVLLLSCLLLAITPKETLHELFANHIDGAYELSRSSAKTQLEKDSIHCHFDSIFTVNTLFSLPTATLIKLDLQSFTKKILSQPVYVSLQNDAVLLRGPPAIDDFNQS